MRLHVDINKKYVNMISKYILQSHLQSLHIFGRIHLGDIQSAFVNPVSEDLFIFMQSLEPLLHHNNAPPPNGNVTMATV